MKYVTKIIYLLLIFCVFSAVTYSADLIFFRKYLFQPVREVSFFFKEINPIEAIGEVYTTRPTASLEVVIGQELSSERHIVADLRMPQKMEKAPAVLLLHGSSPWGRREGLIQLLGMRFHEASFVVLSPDAMNFGESGRPGRLGKLDTLYDSTFVGKCIEYLSSLEAVDPDFIYVLGHSLGAGHALDGALGDPRVKSLILVGPPRFTGLDYGEKSNWKKARYSVDRELDGLLSDDNFIAISRRLDIRSYLNILGTGDHVPLLLIDGEGERAEEREFLGSVAGGIRPPFKYITLPDTGHYGGVFNFYGTDIIFYRSDLFNNFFSEIYNFISSGFGGLDEIEISEGGTVDQVISPSLSISRQAVP